jgi:carboxypeptidase C (cathepsin A)
MFCSFRCLFFLSFCLYASPVTASVCESQPIQKEVLSERTCVTQHTLQLKNSTLSYTATAGTLIINDEHEKPEASIFYTAYRRDPVSANEPLRPVTFCFNGGPGSASLWLNIGAFGPQRIDLPNAEALPPPYSYSPNLYTLLDTTDLVFIDPVSTGFSRPAPGVDVKRFHNVDGDIQSIARFINLYLNRYQLWEAPKFIMGESYGTFRAAGLAAHLHDTHSIYLNGIILVSTVLDFATLRDPSTTNDLPYLLSLPSYTAAAHYHKRLGPQLQKDSVAARAAAESFVYGDYSAALLRGDALMPEEKQLIANKLSELTGVPSEEIARQRLRIPLGCFAKQILKESKQIIGRWDCRYVGYDPRPGNGSSYYTLDPSAEALMGPFTAVFNSYIRRDLGWSTDGIYVPLADVSWDYEPYVNQFASTANQLREVMTKNPYLRVFVASGYYDLATPYFATHYSLQHLGVAPELAKHIEEHRYDAGHMMYLHQPSLMQLKEDLVGFYRRTQEASLKVTTQNRSGS